MNVDSIRKQLGIEPQKGALRTDNGIRNLFFGMDFGRDKSETVIHERLSKFFTKWVKETEAKIFAWIKRNQICYMNPCRAILDGICGVTTPAIYPRGNVAERYEVSEFFIQFPHALPTELKGVAV